MLRFKTKNACHIPLLKIEGYRIEIRKKNIRHIYFKLDPLTKTIVISAPVSIHPEQLNQAIAAKKQWLLKQALKQLYPIQKIEQKVFKDNKLLFLGKSCPVKRIFQPGRAYIKKNQDDLFWIFTEPDADENQIQKTLDLWYREELKKVISVLAQKWQPIINVSVNEFRIKKMKTRWGSCNIRERRIWLNFQLIKLDYQYIEYVIVHEMVHLLEKRHNKRFKDLMHLYLPRWPEQKKQLNQYLL